MRLSLQTDYALRTLMFLAVKDGHHSIADIASAYGISKNHLMKVAQRLTAEGFVESVRGRSGGLKLALPPAELNVGVIVRTMEDTGTFVECFDPATNTCVVTPVCGLRHVLTGALESFARHLDQFSIADLIPNKERLERQIDGGHATVMMHGAPALRFSSRQFSGNAPLSLHDRDWRVDEAEGDLLVS